MSRRRWFSPCLPLMLWASLGAGAELVVLQDTGRSSSLAPLLGVLASPDAIPVKPAVQDLGAADPVRLLPLRSSGLTPGPVAYRPLPTLYEGMLTRPVFLVGADRISKAWLQQHRARLLSLGAVGLLVQAETAQDLNTMATLAAGPPLLPAAATDLVQALDLTHIPVLISRRGIEQ